MHLTKYFLILFLVIFIFIKKIEGKGGRGGGGSRGGGSRSSSSRGSSYRSSGGGYRSPSRFSSGSIRYNYPSYSTYRGGRWSSFGSGIIAFGIMSSLARQGYYSNRANYYYHSTRNSSNRLKADNECINNEDFNGTVFGIFSCPLPGFNDTAKFCCGSLENQTQFCCDYYDKFNITESEDEGTSPFILLIIFAIFFLCLSCYAKTVYDRIKQRCCNSPTRENMNNLQSQTPSMKNTQPNTNFQNLQNNQIPMNSGSQVVQNYQPNQMPTYTGVCNEPVYPPNLQGPMYAGSIHPQPFSSPNNYFPYQQPPNFNNNSNNNNGSNVVRADLVSTTMQNPNQNESYPLVQKNCDQNAQDLPNYEDALKTKANNC